MVGHDIKIMIIDIRGNKVRLGIEAPKNVIVHRQEVYDVIQEEEQRLRDQSEI
jgi:carbon storage regulator